MEYIYEMRRKEIVLSVFLCFGLLSLVCCVWSFFCRSTSDAMISLISGILCLLFAKGETLHSIEFLGLKAELKSKIAEVDILIETLRKQEIVNLSRQLDGIFSDIAKTNIVYFYGYIPEIESIITDCRVLIPNNTDLVRLFEKLDVCSIVAAGRLVRSLVKMREVRTISAEECTPEVAREDDIFATNSGLNFEQNKLRRRRIHMLVSQSNLSSLDKALVQNFINELINMCDEVSKDLIFPPKFKNILNHIQCGTAEEYYYNSVFIS